MAWCFTSRYLRKGIDCMNIDYSVIISLVADITSHCFVIALIFGLAGKLASFALSMILNKKMDL